ncbi:MAG: MFS transporter [Lacunisphaera sp.]|nr:MFS transporter [Lacunisphaera sp.]
MAPSPESAARVYWTAFIGLFFDYYDLYLFVYLANTLTAVFDLTTAQGNWLQFTGLAGVGLGALVFGFLADRFGRGRMMLAVFGVYAAGIAGLSLAWNYESLLAFRLLASLSLGAEWGISHTYLAERVSGERRYRFSALLQFSILGGLLAALATRYALPVVGWRWLFALSILPVAVLTAVRWRTLAGERRAGSEERGASGMTEAPLLQASRSDSLPRAILAGWRPFLLCFALASLTIASGTINVFYAKDLPQSTLYTVLFWGNVAPGMLVGAWVVRRWGVGRALTLYAAGLTALSLGAWYSASARAGLWFALVLPLLNGIPFGLMGAWFNEVFGEYRTMLSGAAYNLGRILAGFAPVLITALGLHEHGRYFLFSAGLGVGVLGLAAVIGRGRTG